MPPGKTSLFERRYFCTGPQVCHFLQLRLLRCETEYPLQCIQMEGSFAQHPVASLRVSKVYEYLFGSGLRLLFPLFLIPAVAVPRSDLLPWNFPAFCTRESACHF